jgi:glucosamine--fructose-6-phosphate aminotransferase (isomerizing)
MSLNVVEGPYVRDILDQPRALAETHRGLDASPALEDIAHRLAAGGFRRVVLTGMGSSYHALHPLNLQLIEAGLPSVMAESSELAHCQPRLLDEGTLLVLVSQSGRSVEIIRLLEMARGRLPTIGLTNTPDSPLAREATALVLTRAGEEATVSCKTYLAAQMALAWLGVVLTGGDREAALRELGDAIPGVAAYLAAWRAHVAALAGLLVGTRVVFYAGRGSSLAAAGAAGLITKESTHRPSEGMSSAAVRHGPLEMLDDGAVVLVWAGEARLRALNERVVADVRRAGARAELMAEDAELPALRLPKTSDLARPVAELLPVEMVTLALAALDGREAGTFTIAGKVTTTE